MIGSLLGSAGCLVLAIVGALKDEPLTSTLVTSIERPGDCRCIAFSQDGKHLALGGGLYGTYTRESRQPGGGLIAICDSSTGAEEMLLKGHTDWVRSICFSPDGKRLASASQDHAVKLWSTENGKELSTFAGHENKVLAVAFSPDGTRIASGSYSEENNLRVWSIDGKQLHAWSGDESTVYSLAFTPDGRLVSANVSSDKVTFWDPG